MWQSGVASLWTCELQAGRREGSGTPSGRPTSSPQGIHRVQMPLVRLGKFSHADHPMACPCLSQPESAQLERCCGLRVCAPREFTWQPHPDRDGVGGGAFSRFR